MTMQDSHETIVLGGGCFWCTEALLKTLVGVLRATPGYAGGVTEDPTYRQVCREGTGHAEVVEVEFDPEVISLEDLLEVFFATHDPTSLNRQGGDVGTQYRSIVLYDSYTQKLKVEKFISELAGKYDKPIVTEVKELERFYPAEEYHRAYYDRNPNEPYCRAVISPKIAKLRHGGQASPRA
ncbi:MAG: peptide-methionine (S)-S-oxide reductase MsrA [Actinomycetota bacterium]|nr:peptide-methionine (S)-S-oxide reductase MsrA [Actinomycetota bacterium]MDD5668318.1 peptide-methionine (S)-S-oxide reductase MsrA [Actinomycetota bacterium]